MVGRGGGLTRAIGQEVLALTGVEAKKNVLIVPSPASTPQNYDKAVADATGVFKGELGARVSVLHKFGEDPSPEQIANELGDAHAVWVTGGRSQLAEEIFRRSGFGQALVDSRGKVISGGSAGMVMQARKAMSWSTPPGRPEDNAFLPVDGLGIVDATVSPHLDFVEKDDGLTEPRSAYFGPFLLDPKNEAGDLGIGVDDAAALAINGQEFRVLTQDGAEPGSGVSVFHRQESGFQEVDFVPRASYAPLEQLTTPR